jgi:hypothetical protein
MYCLAKGLGGGPNGQDLAKVEHQALFPIGLDSLHESCGLFATYTRRQNADNRVSSDDDGEDPDVPWGKQSHEPP